LIFDEPTNHLDMQSKQILQNALKAYSGTYIIVSHDVDFLDPIVEKVLEVQTNSVRTYLGNVSYYLEKKENVTRQKSATKQNSGRSHSRKEERRIEAQIRQKRSKKLKPLQKKLSAVEKKINKTENRLSSLEKEMAEPDFYENGEEEVKNISLEYDELNQRLENSLEIWENLAIKLNRLKLNLT